MNKFLELSYGPVTQHMPKLRANLLNTMGLEARPPPKRVSDVKLIYTVRKTGSRELSMRDKAKLADKIKFELGLELEFVKFDQMSMEEQVRVVGTGWDGINMGIWEGRICLVSMI